MIANDNMKIVKELLILAIGIAVEAVIKAYEKSKEA